jgi:PPOX class probable FMN-dependent enzyme
MEWIEDDAALEACYGAVSPAALSKVADRLTPVYARWIAASRFCVLASVGPAGTDASPRGDDGPVAVALDPGNLAIPDWRGNNRLDSLRNIVADGRVSLMLMVPGSANVVRVNGHARVTADAGLRARFDKRGARPATVIVIAVTEVYFQCSRALQRAALWSGADESAGLPSPGEILAERMAGALDPAAYDADWAERSRKLW